jgi:hypothetical protein
MGILLAQRQVPGQALERRTSIVCEPACANGIVDLFLWGAPGRMDTRIGECSMKPEVTFGYREEAAEVLYA